MSHAPIDSPWRFDRTRQAGAFSDGGAAGQGTPWLLVPCETGSVGASSLFGDLGVSWFQRGNQKENRYFFFLGGGSTPERHAQCGYLLLPVVCLLLVPVGLYMVKGQCN